MVRVVRPGGFIALWQSEKYHRHFYEWFGQDIKLFYACKLHVQLRDEAMTDPVDPIV